MAEGNERILLDILLELKDLSNESLNEWMESGEPP